MTTETNDFEVRITESVQGALNQFSDDVRLNLTSLREELRIERAARHEMEKHLTTMASAIEQTHRSPGAASGRSGPASEEVQAMIAALNERIDRVELTVDRNRADNDDRVNRLIDDANSSLPAIIESSVRDLERSVDHRQGMADTAITKLDERLNNFDVQTARMVEYFTGKTSALSERIDALPTAVDMPDVDMGAIDERIGEVHLKLAALEDAGRKSTADQIDAAERRVDERMTSALRMSDERTGQQLAEMDAFLGNTGHGLDDSIAMLSDRISELDGRIQELSNERLVRAAQPAAAPVPPTPPPPAPAPAPAAAPAPEAPPAPAAPAAPQAPAASRPAVVFHR